VETDRLFNRLRIMQKKRRTIETGVMYELRLDNEGMPRLHVQTEPHDTDADKQ
jgi:hypothetical protein